MIIIEFLLISCLVLVIVYAFYMHVKAVRSRKIGGGRRKGKNWF